MTGERLAMAERTMHVPGKRLGEVVIAPAETVDRVYPGQLGMLLSKLHTDRIQLQRVALSSGEMTPEGDTVDALARELGVSSFIAHRILQFLRLPDGARYDCYDLWAYVLTGRLAWQDREMEIAAILTGGELEAVTGDPAAIQVGSLLHFMAGEKFFHVAMVIDGGRCIQKMGDEGVVVCLVEDMLRLQSELLFAVTTHGRIAQELRLQVSRPRTLPVYYDPSPPARERFMRLPDGRLVDEKTVVPCPDLTLILGQRGNVNLDDVGEVAWAMKPLLRRLAHSARPLLEFIHGVEETASRNGEIRSLAFWSDRQISAEDLIHDAHQECSHYLAIALDKLGRETVSIPSRTRKLVGGLIEVLYGSSPLRYYSRVHDTPVRANAILRTYIGMCRDDLEDTRQRFQALADTVTLLEEKIKQGRWANKLLQGYVMQDLLAYRGYIQESLLWVEAMLTLLGGEHRIALEGVE